MTEHWRFGRGIHGRRDQPQDSPTTLNIMPGTSPINMTVQRFAVLTCVVALLPISVGALVTTLKAGMAFADWPTSDGQNMLLYPWLKDLRQTDKFVEHGHRLAGMLIGFVSIGLVAVTFAKEQSRWVRTFSIIILLAVIGQGLLGGMRVRMNEQVLAMTHSITGGLFFTLCFLFALLVRRPAVSNSIKVVDQRVNPATFAIGILLPLAVLGQYVLGGFFRHLGRMLHEHVAGAIIVTLLVTILVPVLLRSNVPELRRKAVWLGSALLVQVALGLGSWVTKLGFPAFGWVASVNSMAQNITCSLHTVGGMFLLATSSAVAVELLSLARSGQLECLDVLAGSNELLHSATPGSRSSGGIG
ncbi:MAG: COX15/CtaA family protein [Planctomycetaceae bacterium]